MIKQRRMNDDFNYKEIATQLQEKTTKTNEK